jgi:hypothetical protein
VKIPRLLAIGGFDETLRTGYDWDCWIRLILDGSLAGSVDEPHLEYRLRHESLTAGRIGSLWDRVRVLEKASANPSLLAEERPELLRSLRHHRTRAVLAEAVERIERRENARAWFLRHATAPGVSRAARLPLALAAAAPRTALRYLPHDPGALEQRFSAAANSGAPPGAGHAA